MRRTTYFDILNIISCIAVIGLHHNGIVHSFSNTTNWASALVFEVIFYFAVPIFFMLSGSNLLNYRNKCSTNEFLKKRFYKTFIPFLFWSLMWAGISYFVFNVHIDTLCSLLSGIIHCSYQPVYWFFIPLFGLYLLMPVLSCLDKSKLLYLAILLLITQGVLVPIETIFGLKTLSVLHNDMSGPVMFAIFGFLLSQNYIFKKYNKILYLIACICICIRYAVIYSFSMKNGELYRGLFDYYSIISVFPALAIFTLARDNNVYILSDRSQMILKKLSSCSFGVYLIHTMIMLLEKIFFNQLGFSISGNLYRIFMIPITYLICLCVVLFFKRYKFGRIIFP